MACKKTADHPSHLGTSQNAGGGVCICKKRRFYMGHDLIKGGKTRFKKGRHYKNKSGQVNRRQTCPTDQLEVRFHPPRILICFQN